MHTVLNQQQLDASIKSFIARKIEKYPELAEQGNGEKDIHAKRNHFAQRRDVSDFSPDDLFIWTPRKAHVA